VTYPHPILEKVLERTLGVPLFQEQLMQMAIAIGDCTGDEADLLRRAMGSKRGIERIESIKATLFAGMESRGLLGEQAEQIYVQILSFASFGFAESHALSFALLVYASSWFKLRYPAAFLAGLLRSQPMGFYSPQSLVQDARRHGVEVLRPDIVASAAQASLEALEEPTSSDEHRYDVAFAVRLGLDEVRGIGADVAARIVAARDERPFRDMVDLSRRATLDSGQLEALATAGVFACWGLSRREALWNAGFTEREDQLEGAAAVIPAPMLPGLDPVGETLADLWATRVTPSSHPFGHLRPVLDQVGILRIDGLGEAESGRRVHVAGLVTHRQRPGTAGGVTFLNLEDESGMLNVICTEGVWNRYRTVARTAAGMVIRGVLERNDGVTNLLADKISSLEGVSPHAAQALQARHASRDFQ
jgi:error-prone DNA polymerase